MAVSRARSQVNSPQVKRLKEELDRQGLNPTNREVSLCIMIIDLQEFLDRFSPGWRSNPDCPEWVEKRDGTKG